jgi:DNA invertase Pin-like site-specific DNA recombinase
VQVIDDDLGLSGDRAAYRPGFTRVITEVALGHVVLVLGFLRLARNNAEWDGLVELCGVTDT